MDNEVPYRNTNMTGLYLILSITLFFKRYKSVILNELYYKGLINLHGDVGLFIKAKTANDIKYLNIAASITQKGMVYYKLHIQKAGPELKPTPVSSEMQRPKLSIVR